MHRSGTLVLVVLVLGCRDPSSPPREPEPVAPALVGAEPVVVGPAAIEAEPHSMPVGPRVEVPAGEFTRGTDPTERVELPSFWIDRLEVSNAEYEQCVASGNCAVRRLWQCTRFEAGAWLPVADPSPYLDPDQPAVCVSHGEAAGYCMLRGARLASRSEWEKAARGTDGRRYPWGDDPPNCDRANFSECGHTAAEQVGSHPDRPSPYGALDLAGNVAEWVMPDVGPDGMYEQGSDAEIRGGHFGSAPTDLQAAARVFLASTQERSVNVGFRCAGDRG